MKSLKLNVCGYELFEAGGLIMAERETRSMGDPRDTRGPFYTVEEARGVLSAMPAEEPGDERAA